MAKRTPRTDRIEPRTGSRHGVIPGGVIVNAQAGGALSVSRVNAQPPGAGRCSCALARRTGRARLGMAAKPGTPERNAANWF